MSSKIKDERDLLSKPGDTILETLECMRMSQVALAKRMGRTPSKVNDIISGKEPITTVTALQLEKVLGIDAQFWLNREMLYREQLTRLDEEETLMQYMGWLKMQPVKELKKLGYLKSDRLSVATVHECLKFYGVVAPMQWEALYVDEYVSAKYKNRVEHEGALGALSAWLPIGEIEMRKWALKPYNKEVFKESLQAIRKLVSGQAEHWADSMQDLCRQAGVALVFTDCISKVPIGGAVRWVGGHPLIQMASSYTSNDRFWYTFFHEAAHVLLHGRKEVFLEHFEGYVPDAALEKEADAYAHKMLLPVDIKSELKDRITEQNICDIAQKYTTHPAIVLGRLQHLGLVPVNFGNALKIRVSLGHGMNKAG